MGKDNFSAAEKAEKCVSKGIHLFPLLPSVVFPEGKLAQTCLNGTP